MFALLHIANLKHSSTPFIPKVISSSFTLIVIEIPLICRSILSKTYRVIWSLSSSQEILYSSPCPSNRYKGGSENERRKKSANPSFDGPTNCHTGRLSSPLAGWSISHSSRASIDPSLCCNNSACFNDFLIFVPCSPKYHINSVKSPNYNFIIGRDPRGRVVILEISKGLALTILHPN